MNARKRIIKNKGNFVDGIKFNVEFDGRMFQPVYCIMVACKNNPDLFFFFLGGGADFLF